MYTFYHQNEKSWGSMTFDTKYKTDSTLLVVWGLDEIMY